MKVTDLLEARKQLSPRVKITSVDAIRKIALTECSVALKYAKMGKTIWRGVDVVDEEMYLVGNSNLGNRRVSANTSNFYTLIIDNSPAWVNFPKRSRSFVCSTEVDYAHNYGYPYLVLPFDDAKIGICPKGDIWDSFKFARYFGIPIHNLDDLNNRIVKFLQVGTHLYYGMGKPLSGPDKDIKTFISVSEKARLGLLKSNSLITPEVFTKINSKLKYGIHEIVAFINTFQLSPYYKVQNGFFKWLEQAFLPEVNGFSAGTSTILGNKHKAGREVWIQGKAVFIGTVNNEAFDFLENVK